MARAPHTEIEIAPGLIGQREHELTFRHSGGLDVRVRVRYDDQPTMRQYICEEYALVLPDLDRPATITTGQARDTSTSREYGVEDATRRAAWAAVHEAKNRNKAEPWGLEQPPVDLLTGWPVKDDESRGRFLRWVGHLYRIGYALDAAPAKYVQDRLGLGSTTAGRYIDAARQAGLITDVKRSGRAGTMLGEVGTAVERDEAVGIKVKKGLER